jgi:cyanate lyase
LLISNKRASKRRQDVFFLSGTRFRLHRRPETGLLCRIRSELIMVNGPAWKAPIEEESGDGIMSAIDFDMQIDREPNPKCDRVRISMSGKFLPYKYYGNEQGIPEVGYKVE